MVTWGYGEWEWGLPLNEHWVSVWNDEKILEMHDSDDHPAM